MGLDGVELVMAFEEVFEISISDAEAEAMQTPHDAIEFICKTVQIHEGDSICLSQRAFHQIRRGLTTACSIPRSSISLDVRLLDIFDKKTKQNLWTSFKAHTQFHSLPSLSWGVGKFFKPITVRDVVTHVMTNHIKQIDNSKVWTKESIREMVRIIISDQLGIDDFSNNDHFIRDLGIG